MSMLTDASPTDRRPPDATGQRRAGAFSRILGRLSTWRAWLPLATAYAVFAGAFFASSAPFAIPVVEAACGAAPLDVRTGTSADDVHAFLLGCGPTGREAYQALQVADLVYPLVFALFLASSLAIVLRRLAPGRPGLVAWAALPLAASAFDYLENACAWLALAAYPSAAPADGLLVLASDAKTITSWLAGLLLLGGCAALVARAARWRVDPARRGG